MGSAIATTILSKSKMREVRQIACATDFICADVKQALHDLTRYHAGLGSLAKRLANHLTSLLPDTDGGSLLDTLLSGMLHEFDAELAANGAEAGYKKAIIYLYHRLHRVLDYRLYTVSASKVMTPKEQYWDCLSHGLLEYIRLFNITKLEVEYAPMECGMSIDKRRLFVAARLFTRDDFKALGLPEPLCVVSDGQPSTLSTHTLQTQLSDILCHDNLVTLEQLSAHHSGIETVLTKLASYCTSLLGDSSYNLVNELADVAMHEFQANLSSPGLDSAYAAFLDAIIDKLPCLFEYKVVATKVDSPDQHLLVWDCLKGGLSQWLSEHNVKEIAIYPSELPANYQRHDAALVLANNILTRYDLQYLFLPPAGFFKMQGFDLVRA